MMVEKKTSSLALDEANGAKLWDASQALVERHATTAGDALEDG